MNNIKYSIVCQKKLLKSNCIECEKKSDGIVKISHLGVIQSHSILCRD